MPSVVILRARPRAVELKLLAGGHTPSTSGTRHPEAGVDEGGSER